MKQFRVTLTYTFNNERRTLSTVIPACNDNTAIAGCMKAHSISQVIEKKAEEISPVTNQ